MMRRLANPASERSSILLLFLAMTAHAQDDVAAAPSIDACALLTPEEISDSVALKVANGARRDEGVVPRGGYSSSCVWEIEYADPPTENASAPLGGRHFIILNAIRWPAGQGLEKTYLDAFRQAANEGVIPHQPATRDFGDEALWWGDGLAVRKGDISFGISVFIPGARAQVGSQREERLVPLILKKM